MNLKSKTSKICDPRPLFPGVQWRRRCCDEPYPASDGASPYLELRPTVTLFQIGNHFPSVGLRGARCVGRNEAVNR